MDAIITAGGLISPDDPLYPLVQVDKKALILLAGKPMICWIIDALRGSALVDHIIIVGLNAEELACQDQRLYFVGSVGGLIENIFAGVDELRRVNPAVKKFLLLSSDIPLVTPEIIQGFVEECGDQAADIYYAVVEEKTMEARFPQSKRTYIPFKGGRYTGGDIFLFDMNAADENNIELGKALTGSRKNYLAQAHMIGFGFILRMLLRMMTVHEAARRASAKVYLDGRAVDTRFAELGMDLDKPLQYAIIKASLEEGQAQAIN